ncbi:MAG: hypothetical protein PHP50_01255 [Lachnospiraceae bacterium]|nr:hypothetical protein [Lachnospiraceae bacterium]
MVSFYEDLFDHLRSLISSEKYKKLNGLEQVMQVLIARACYVKDHPYCSMLYDEVELMVVREEIDTESCQKYLDIGASISKYFMPPLEKGKLDGSIKKDLRQEETVALLYFTFETVSQRLMRLYSNPAMGQQIDTWEIMRNTLEIIRKYLAN